MRFHSYFVSAHKLLYILALLTFPACAEPDPTVVINNTSASSVAVRVDPITLEGVYEFRSDQTSLEVRGKQICFFPNKSSSKKIPRPSGDLRLPWFCFSNLNHAASLLGVSFEVSDNNCGVEGKAKIIVVDYELYKEEGDGNDFAKLFEVIEVSSIRQFACAE